MNPQLKSFEHELNNRFKTLQKQLEDFWCNEGNDKLSEIVDKVAQEKYLNVRNMARTIKEFCNSKDFDIDKLYKLTDKFQDLINSINDYLYDRNNKEGVAKDIVTVSEDSKHIAEEIIEIKSLAYYSDLQRLSNTIEYRYIQTTQRIAYIVNNIIAETMDSYTELINEEIMNTQNIVNDKLKQVKSVDKRTKIKKISTKKIFDYKKMNKLLQGNGYKEVRQTGDHKIFSDGIKSIPIPQHKIGKGLSSKIQGQIKMEG